MADDINNNEGVDEAGDAGMPDDLKRLLARAEQGEDGDPDAYNPDADEEMLTVKQWMPYSTPCEISTKKALQNVVDYLDRHHAEAYMGSTQLMIAPGFQYRIISGMITNFHQPQSTLLLLVSAFVGVDHWRAIYDYALDHDFRFLSYGDACFFQK